VPEAANWFEDHAHGSRQARDCSTVFRCLAPIKFATMLAQALPGFLIIPDRARELVRRPSIVSHRRHLVMPGHLIAAASRCGMAAPDSGRQGSLANRFLAGVALARHVELTANGLTIESVSLSKSRQLDLILFHEGRCSRQSEANQIGAFRLTRFDTRGRI